MFTSLFHHYKSSFAGLSKEVWMLAASSLINRAGAMVIPFMTIYLTNKLDFSAAEAGYIMACFGGGSLLGSYLGGKCSDAFGYFNTMVFSFCVGGLLFFPLDFLESFWSIAVLVFLLSTVNDLFRPALFASVALFSKEENRTRSLSLIRLAVNVGYAAGPAIGGIIAASHGYSLLFYIDGISCILAGIFIFTFIPKDREDKEETLAKETSGSVWAHQEFLIFLLLTICTATIFMQLIFVFPMYLKNELGYTEDTVGYLLAFNCLLVALLEMPLVHFFEKKNTTLFWIMVGTAFIGFSYLLLPLDLPYLLAPIFFMILISIGEIFMFPFTNSYALSLSNADNRGTYMGYYSMSFSIGLIIAPIVGTQIVNDFGYPTLWMTLSIFAVLLLMGFAFLNKKQ